jgi:Protein of unknown function (DUF1549)
MIAIRRLQYVREALGKVGKAPAFILAELERRGWKMQAEADRPMLIRRAYFDLTGLPPTPAEVQAFVDDKSPKLNSGCIR